MRHKKIHSFFILLAMILLITTVAYAADPLTITTQSLPKGKLGEPYSVKLEASGGEGDYTFFVARGLFPKGLELNPDTGVLSGIPEDGGMFGSIYFGVRDSAGHETTKQIILRISSKIVNFTVWDDRVEYDGQPHTVRVVPDANDVLPEDYTITYSGQESQTNIGTYSIKIQGAGLVSKGYRVGSVRPSVLAISPNSSSTIRLLSETFEYDEQPHPLTPIVEPAEIQNDYTVTYRGRGDTEYGPSEEPPSVVGTYTVTATTNNPNYVTRTATANLNITAPRVNFTVADISADYDGQPHQAVVSLNTSGYDGGFAVTYDDLSTDEVETLEAATDAGQYRINIALTDPNHQVGTMTANTFTVRPREIDFTVTDNDVPYQAGVNNYKATINPSIEGFKDYIVTYVKDGDEYTGSVPEAGTYEIRITLDDTNNAKTSRNNVLHSISSQSFTVRKTSVDFMVTNNDVTFDISPESTGQSATVTPSIPGFTDFKVIYVDESNHRYEDKVTDIGTYTIEIEFTGDYADNYELGNIDDNTFVVKPVVVNFTVGSPSADYNPADTEGYSADVTPSISEFKDFTVTYVAADGTESQEKVANAGEYDIVVKLTDDAAKHYSMGTVSAEKFTVNPYAVNFTVTENEVSYEPGKDSYSANVSAVNPEGFSDFKVIYADEAGATQENSVDGVGEYTIQIAFTGENAGNYRTGTITPNTFKVIPKVVDFTVADATVSFDPEIAEYKAAVTAKDMDNFTDYTVVYVKDGLEHEGKVTDVGEYEIQIRLSEAVSANYQVGTVTPDKFNVTPCVVNFTVSKNTVEYNPDKTSYAAVITPSVDGFTKYNVTYTKEGGEPLANEITATDNTVIGIYDIGIEVTDGNYTLGTVSGGSKFIINSPLAQIILNKGNSPAALIGDDEAAQAAFKADHMYNGVAYNPAAWGDVSGENYKNHDEDQEAYFIIDKNVNKADLGCYATYSDGREVNPEDMAITVEGEDFDTWLAKSHANGVYEMTYSFTDNGEPFTATRKLVLLNRMGDTNSDRNINAGDARYLQSQVLDAPEGTEFDSLYLYRICDVNHDGVVDDKDVAAIMNRMNEPLVGYYQ